MTDNESQIEIRIDYIVYIAAAWQLVMLYLRLTGATSWNWFVTFLPMLLIFTPLMGLVFIIGLMYSISMVGVFRAWIAESEDQENLVEDKKE